MGSSPSKPRAGRVHVSDGISSSEETGRSQQSHPTTESDESPVRSSRDVTYNRHIGRSSLRTANGQTIVVIQGDLCEQKVDGLVNSVDSNYDLRAGAVSKAILAAAGPQIQTELKSLKPGTLQFGQVVVTRGYRLHARHVFHGVLKVWGSDHSDDDDDEDEDEDDQDAETILRQFIRNVLDKAGEKQLKSLAFPAIGTGDHEFPVEIVASCLFEEYAMYVLMQETSLTELRAVVSDKVTYDKFSEALKLCSGQPASESRPDDTSNWSPPDPVDPYKKLELEPSDSEYKTVTENITDTIEGTSFTIVKIERIENRTLWKTYAAHRKTMKDNGHQMNERLLWHGTKKDCVNNICNGGFNRNFCGENAAKYGNGVYFARDFSYSAQDVYSPSDTRGIKYIFQCRVLTGYFAKGAEGIKEPPWRMKHVRYDSVVNDVDDPEIFVVFKDMQCYPEYLVSFKIS